jgi:hypothetical protein
VSRYTKVNIPLLRLFTLTTCTNATNAVLTKCQCATYVLIAMAKPLLPSYTVSVLVQHCVSQCILLVGVFAVL